MWFDQNELVGGDAWDAKIRGQIAGCALFVPVISANTQARLEGYFRLEWKLAAQRTHTMADEKVFLLPVVIDDTRDAAAKVPAEFRAVQWTRLRPMGSGAASPPGSSGAASPAEGEGKALAAFCARVGKLLGGDDGSAAAEAGARLDRAREDGRGRASSLRKAARARWIAVAAATVVIVGTAMWLTQRRPAAAVQIRSQPAAGAEVLAARAYHVTQRIGFTRDELAAAADLARQAVELDPTSGRVRAVQAWVAACHLMRNWDVGDARRTEVQTLAQRALALAPDDGDALNALFQVWEKQGALTEAEMVARKAVQVAPDNYRGHLSLGRALSRLGRVTEEQAVLRAAVRRFPENVLCHYELANSFVGFGFGDRPLKEEELVEGLALLDTILAKAPFASASLLKAVIVAAYRGDLAAMRMELDRLAAMPLAERTEDRAVFVAMWAGLLERRPDRTLAAGNLIARGYFEDLMVAGPKAWLTALARKQEGKGALAQQAWQAAEVLLRQRLRENPEIELNTIQLATTLAWQDRLAEAAVLAEPLERAWREQPTSSRYYQLALYHAARGDGERTAQQLRPILNTHNFTTDVLLTLDPWWERVRDHPDVRALQAEMASGREKAAPAASAAAPAAEKSVAVLAFKNLSDDRDTEYFSDGVSEELGNVLGRVPGLRVASSTSAFSFKGKAVPVAEIARQLGVAYVVEGSVRKMGTTLRINAKLVQASDGFPVWSSGNLEREVKNLFALQDEIAGLIAQNLSLRLVVRSDREQETVSAQAFEFFLQARVEVEKSTVAGLDRAEALLNQAVELAPRFGRAHAGLANVWARRGVRAGTVGQFAQRGSPEMRRIFAKAEAALALDPNSEEVHAVLGLTHWLGWNFTAAERAVQVALKINPSHAMARQLLARVQETEGRIDEATASLRLAAELDPLSGTIASNLAARLAYLGRYSEAMVAVERALELKSESPDVWIAKAEALLGLGRIEEAVALARAPNNSLSDSPRTLARILAARGDNAEALALLRSMASFGGGGVAALVELGRKDEALAAISTEQMQAAYIGSMLVLSSLDPIRNSPEFRRFLEELGLTEAHARAQAWRAANPPEKPAAKR